MTTAPGDFRVDPEMMRTHASTVDKIASQVGTGADAAGTTVDPSAFGIMCGFLAPAATLICATATSSVRGVGKDLGELAAEFRAAANRFDKGEQQASSTYSKSKRDFSTTLGGGPR